MHTASKRPSLGHEHSFGNSLAKVSRDGCLVSYVRKSEQCDLFIFFLLLLLLLLTNSANNTKCKKATHSEMT